MINESNEAWKTASKQVKKMISKDQYKTMYEFVSKGSDCEEYRELFLKLSNIQLTAPKIYSQEKNKNPDVILHYFKNGFNWYITELDYKTGQAFGLVKMHDTELGYISIPELVENDIELDLYFKKASLDKFRKTDRD